MFTKNFVVTIITTLIFVSSVCADKFRFCAVDGRGHFKKATKYCPSLKTPDSRVTCVIGIDRLDCLRKISKQQVDFAVFTSEDLITASNSAVETLITNELRFTEDKYEYEVVAVFHKKSNIKSRHDLQDKRFCHPGYGYESDWTRILSNYLEASVIPQTCQQDLTLTENRIKSSSEFFSIACKSGPWVENSTLDNELKNKYPNLCEACDKPSSCSKDDKYWGRRGSLYCLTDGAGDISWARWDDAQVHFGLVSGEAEAPASDYNLLCPDDTVRPVNTTNPCVWVVKPWSVIASVRNKAQDIQEMISSLTHDDDSSWQAALLNLMEPYHLTIKPLTPIEPIQSYLNKATGFLSANSFPGCHPPRTIRLCTTSIVENSKCGWLREAMASYGIEPGVDCLKADNKTHCMDAVHKDFADVAMVDPDLLKIATTTYQLKTLFYETVNEDAKYLTVAITKENANFESFQDLKGARACFPSYDGIAWNSVANHLNQERLFEVCPILEAVEDFFGESCAPGVPKEGSSLHANCRNSTYDGDYGAIRCLIENAGDVAFVSRNSLRNFLADSEYLKDLLAEAKRTNDSGPSTSENLASPPVDILVNSHEQNFFELENSENSPSRKLCSVWSYEQTMCLIQSMATYQNDFNDPRKRKYVFEYAANDLISAGFAVDTKNITIKWKGLLRSYNRAKDQKRRTGQGPSRFLFFEAIDEIVGKKPKNSCSHSINSLEMTAGPSENNDLGYQHDQSEGNLDQNVSMAEEDLEAIAPPSPDLENAGPSSRTKMSEKDMKKEYLELKRKEMVDKERRHKELTALLKEKNEIEKKKCELFERYLAGKGF